MSVYVSGILGTLTDPLTILYVFIGTFMGLVFGCLPGLTASMGIALLIPLTFTLDAVPAIGMMLGCYVGGMAGGAIAAILLNIPGTPSAVVTCLDGHPMAENGQANKALGWAVFASGAGSLVSWAILVVAATSLAKLCTSFSAPEYASLALFGLTIIAAVSGKNLAKGLVAVQANLDIAGSLPSVTGSNTVRNALKEAATKVSGGAMTAEEAMAECVATCNAALQAK